ncbi:hypothetical protein NDU88_005947 [Pleurodeles waltl]|uniref:Uncharacterized protein n=1 Tax=Pleurodeles waltl TaxID=8319 RepID=A0AAV7MXS4_PLEWA|nr:hypothetical protein NDU88_005947 [Pleurodeles waltl]
MTDWMPFEEEEDGQFYEDLQGHLMGDGLTEGSVQKSICRALEASVPQKINQALVAALKPITQQVELPGDAGAAHQAVPTSKARIEDPLVMGEEIGMTPPDAEVSVGLPRAATCQLSPQERIKKQNGDDVLASERCFLHPVGCVKEHVRNSSAEISRVLCFRFIIRGGS